MSQVETRVKDTASSSRKEEDHRKFLVSVYSLQKGDLHKRSQHLKKKKKKSAVGCALHPEKKKRNVKVKVR